MFEVIFKEIPVDMEYLADFEQNVQPVTSVSGNESFWEIAFLQVRGESLWITTASLVPQFVDSQDNLMADAFLFWPTETFLQICWFKGLQCLP